MKDGTVGGQNVHTFPCFMKDCDCLLMFGTVIAFAI